MNRRIQFVDDSNDNLQTNIKQSHHTCEVGWSSLKLSVSHGVGAKAWLQYHLWDRITHWGGFKSFSEMFMGSGDATG
jgi:hypothetical protein